MSAVPDDATGAAAPGRAEQVNDAVAKYARKAANNIVTNSSGVINLGDRNAQIIAASMYALAVELGLVEIEKQ